MKLTYITSFARKNEKYNLIQSPATNTKVQYILDVIKKNGYEVNLITAISTKNKFKCFYKKEVFEYDSNETDIRLATFGSRFKFIRGLNLLVLYFNLFKYLILNVSKIDTVIVYHSLGYMLPVKLAKKIKKFRLILEVEEIYGDVIAKSKIVKRELKYFKMANSFIFSTELLNTKININNKPYSVVNGTYQVEKKLNYKFDDGKIHCVYAGTFAPDKGVGAVISAALYLDFNYHIHIIGFGKENDEINMKKHIDLISQKTRCTLTYDGFLSGVDYIRFIQSCHIGLSPQNLNANFNETSFPSKVLSYLSNGLRVVSIRIKALEKSAINDLLYYYDEDTPQAIASAIKKVNIVDNYDSRDRIRELDKEFIRSIKKLIG